MRCKDVNKNAEQIYIRGKLIYEKIISDSIEINFYEDNFSTKLIIIDDITFVENYYDGMLHGIYLVLEKGKVIKKTFFNFGKIIF